MASKSFRQPAVAGTFYANGQSRLRKQIEWCFRYPVGPGQLPPVINHGNGPRRILGLISPHAGYAYSGPVAAHSYYELASDGKPDLVIVVGPNHRGLGAPLAVGHCDIWRTPLGEVPVDIEAAKQIVLATQGAQLDDVAHIAEHSIELQIPFLQFLYGNAFSIVPIAILAQEPSMCIQLGQAIASVMKGRNAVVIASTDLTHYESHQMATKKDHIAIERILQLEIADLFEVIRRYGITMCGPGPITTAVVACKEMGASSARLLRYATSGDIAGGFEHVVGYAALEIH